MFDWSGHESLNQNAYIVSCHLEVWQMAGVKSFSGNLQVGCQGKGNKSRDLTKKVTYSPGFFVVHAKDSGNLRVQNIV